MDRGVEWWAPCGLEHPICLTHHFCDGLVVAAGDGGMSSVTLSTDVCVLYPHSSCDHISYLRTPSTVLGASQQVLTCLALSTLN